MRAVKTKKCFLICPVRGVGKKDTEDIVQCLEDDGWNVHWPPRDTDQQDDVGLRICNDNRTAIKDADVIFIVWDGKSQGCLFDAGMAFAFNKEIVCLDLPPATSEKSFQNMFSKWDGRTYEETVICFSVPVNDVATDMSARTHVKRLTIKAKLEMVRKHRR